MRDRRWRALLAGLLVFSLIAAACGGDDEDEETGTTDDTEATDDTGGDGEATEIETDFGVTDDTIRVGMIADLSGIFAPLVVEIVEAQKVYFEMVNDNGGIAGREVELVIEDNAYDTTKHQEIYERMRAESDEGVVWIGESTGTPHTASIAQLLVDDNLGAIPLSWYSGWPDPDFGQNVFEFQTNYCIEAINGIDFIAREGGEKLAILSFPGDYGQDGAVGAKLAAEELGLEIVYDGEAKVVPGADQTPVIAELVDSGADWVWATINPGTLGEIMSGAAAEGFDANWSGNAPTYSFKLLGTELAPLLDEHYYYSTYTVTWGEDVPGMETLVSEFQERRPDAPISDVYIRGWTEAMATHQILEQAAENGDMTRAGVVAAANEIEVDFEGLAPAQRWGDVDVNENLVRESYIYDIEQSEFNVVPVTEEGGSTGSVLAEGPFVSDLAEEYEYEGACFAPQS